jgi:hypothetical protein
MQRQQVGNEAFFGDDHDIQGGDGLGRTKAKTFAQDAFDAIANHGIADFFADGHAEAPGGVPVLARQGEQQKGFAMIAATGLEAGREFPLRPNPVRRGEA